MVPFCQVGIVNITFLLTRSLHFRASLILWERLKVFFKNVLKDNNSSDLARHSHERRQLLSRTYFFPHRTYLCRHHVYLSVCIRGHNSSSQQLSGSPRHNITPSLTENGAPGRSDFMVRSDRKITIILNS